MTARVATDVNDVNDVAPDRLVIAFARSLRRAGLVVPVDATITFGDALARLGVRHGDHVYWAGRAVFVRRPEDIVAYDRVFGAFFGGLAGSTRPDPIAERIAGVDDEQADADDAGEPGDDIQAIRFSRHEVLRQRDFARYDDDDRRDAARIVHALRLNPTTRSSRRRAASRRSRGHPDLRATIRDALRTDGEVVRRRYREPSRRPRRVVLLLDVSGSMEPYAREFVRFLHTAVVGRASVEAFALGTRLTRLTRELATRDPDAAIAAAAARVTDWSGGTRLGDTLRSFNDTWGVRGMARGAIVVILSDGWDRGDPGQLGAEMQRLARVSHRVVWVNPLKASPGYVPIAQGMAAALPFVDEFVEGHSLAALERVAAAVGDPGKTKR